MEVSYYQSRIKAMCEERRALIQENERSKNELMNVQAEIEQKTKSMEMICEEEKEKGKEWDDNIKYIVSRYERILVTINATNDYIQRMNNEIELLTQNKMLLQQQLSKMDDVQLQDIEQLRQQKEQLELQNKEKEKQLNQVKKELNAVTQRINANQQTLDAFNNKEEPTVDVPAPKRRRTRKK